MLPNEPCSHSFLCTWGEEEVDKLTLYYVSHHRLASPVFFQLGGILKEIFFLQHTNTSRSSSPLSMGHSFQDSRACLKLQIVPDAVYADKDIVGISDN